MDGHEDNLRLEQHNQRRQLQFLPGHGGDDSVSGKCDHRLGHCANSGEMPLIVDTLKTNQSLLYAFGHMCFRFKIIP
jgi:hypothetical protein